MRFLLDKIFLVSVEEHNRITRTSRVRGVPRQRQLMQLCIFYRILLLHRSRRHHISDAYTTMVRALLRFPTHSILGR
uniref:Uncharacterized protein n=1 Tax=Taenia asiatica TaxID=60517 RepID=A0A0R3WFL3_TAEAS